MDDQEVSANQVVVVAEFQLPVRSGLGIMVRGKVSLGVRDMAGNKDAVRIEIPQIEIRRNEKEP